VEEDLSVKSLTQVVPLPPREKTPLLVSVEVSEELDGPFLVSSSDDFLWMPERLRTGELRAAVRKILLPQLWAEAVRRVLRKSEEEGWGSAAPATKEGARRVVDHLSEYGLGEVEVLHGSGFDLGVLPLSLPAVEEAWVPPGWAIVIPQDRAYLGTTFTFPQGNAACVLHNPSRALGILF
jgi:hypothetical protein